MVTLIKDPPPGAPVPPILPPQDGYLFLDKAKFARVVRGRRRRGARPRSWPTRRCRGASTRSAARSPSRRGRAKPSWYLVATEDQMIPPAAQRLMAKRAGSTVVEEPGSHAIYVSQPQAVAALIAQAAKGAVCKAAA